MSAFVVGTDHIDYLVTAATTWHGMHSVDAVHLDDEQADAVKAAGGHTEPAYFGGHTWHPARQPDTLGRILLGENITSVRTRYPNDTPDTLPGPIPTPQAEQYTHRFVSPTHLDPAQVIRAIDCWQYQTCEYNGAQTAPGWVFTQRLYKVAVERLLDSRDDLQWEWDRATARDHEQAQIAARLAQS